MAYNLFLDDVREIWSDSIVARSYAEFVACIEKNGLPKSVSFDHDLGEDKTGTDCARWLADYCMKHNLDLPLWQTHSSNPVGRLNISSVLNSYEKTRRMEMG